MARTRTNKADNNLPKRVYRGRSAYEWKPTSSQTVKLCGLEAPISEVWRCWEEASNEAAEKSKVHSLISMFIGSADFAELSSETQKDYRKYSKNILAVFGKMHVDKVEPQHVRIYMDKRGLKSRVQANREHAFFSRCYRYGYERGLCKGNPCKGVRKFKENARTRYVTDIEYQALYDHADNVVKVAMELAYLCCARQQDVLSMRTSQILDHGIFIAQGKTGVQQVKLWTTRLRSVIKMAKSLANSGISSTYVLCKPDGGNWSRDGFNSRWAKAKSDTRLATGLPIDFTFHDLKAKGISDLEGNLQDKQAISGHKNIGQTARYDRKVKEVPVVGGELKK